MTVNFLGCKHLDYQDKYTAKKCTLGTGQVFWLRDVPENLPHMVQFCKLQGRLNSPTACLNPGQAHCNQYEELVHHVEITDES